MFEKVMQYFYSSLKQIQTSSKLDTTKPIYSIITIYKHVQTCSKNDAIIPKEAITIARLGWAGLGWPGLANL